MTLPIFPPIRPRLRRGRSKPAPPPQLLAGPLHGKRTLWTVPRAATPPSASLPAAAPLSAAPRLQQLQLHSRLQARTGRRRPRPPSPRPAPYDRCRSQSGRQQALRARSRPPPLALCTDSTRSSTQRLHLYRNTPSRYPAAQPRKRTRPPPPPPPAPRKGCSHPDAHCRPRSPRPRPPPLDLCTNNSHSSAQWNPSLPGCLGFLPPSPGVTRDPIVLVYLRSSHRGPLGPSPHVSPRFPEPLQ